MRAESIAVAVAGLIAGVFAINGWLAAARRRAPG